MKKINITESQIQQAVIETAKRLVKEGIVKVPVRRNRISRQQAIVESEIRRVIKEDEGLNGTTVNQAYVKAMKQNRPEQAERIRGLYNHNLGLEGNDEFEMAPRYLDNKKNAENNINLGLMAKDEDGYHEQILPQYFSAEGEVNYPVHRTSNARNARLASNAYNHRYDHTGEAKRPTGRFKK